MMGTNIEILKTILPVILALMIGMITRSRSVFSRKDIDALKSVAVNIALPAVVFHAFSSMEYSWRNILVTVIMFLICLTAWFLGRCARRLPGLESSMVPLLTTGFEAGMLGYALFTMLYGEEQIGRLACVDLGQALFVFTVYKILAGREQKKDVSAAGLIREMVTSPTMIAIMAGILLGATGLYKALEPSGVSSLLDACTSFVSAPTSMLILITIGYDLVLTEIPWKKVGMVAILRVAVMLVMRITAGLAVRALGLGNSLDQALNILFILPPPYVLPVFADDENQRAYVSSSLSLITLLSLAAFFILVIAERM